MADMGTKARPEETVTTELRGRVFRCVSSACVSRIGPRRLVATVASASSSEAGASAIVSTRMTPALWITTLRSGCAAISLVAKAGMAAASAMSSVIAAMPGLARTTSSSASPAMTLSSL